MGTCCSQEEEDQTSKPSGATRKSGSRSSRSSSTSKKKKEPQLEEEEEDVDNDLDYNDDGTYDGVRDRQAMGRDSAAQASRPGSVKNTNTSRDSAAETFWSSSVDSNSKKGEAPYITLDHKSGQHQKLRTSNLRKNGGPTYNKSEKPDEAPSAPYQGGQHDYKDNLALYDAKSDYFSKDYQIVPGLYSYMFDNSAKDPKYNMLQLQPDPKLHSFVNLHENHQSYPKSLFIDSLGSELQSRTCGRYNVLSKTWNQRPAYFSRMARMYMYNASDNPHEPEWAVSRRLGASSFILLMKGEIHTPEHMAKMEIFTYDKYSDNNHIRGRLSNMGIIAPPIQSKGGSRKIRLSEGGGAKMFRRTIEIHTNHPPNLSAYVKCEDISVQPCMTEGEIKSKCEGVSRNVSYDIIRQQNSILQKEWYIAKHTPLLVYKTSGAPTFTVGCYLPIIDEYANILPPKAKAVLARTAAHYKKKNPEENYLRFPKYFCAENELYMFFNPVKCQWKVISSAEMHMTHSVKACSEMPTRVIFPPLVDWQAWFDVKIQVPSPESSDVDHHLASQGIELFIDRDFPPNERSIADRSRKGVPGEIKWYRAREIHDSDFPVNLFDNISAADIVQGGLGDCWLLAALAVVAEYPQFIPTYTFHQNQCNLEGRYQFNLFDYSRGTWVVVEIDDYIPCYPKSAYSEMPIPRFSQPNGNEIWLLLLEKAFAKMVGGYMNLKAGYAGLAWMMLTGCMDYNRWILEKGSSPRTWRRRPIMMYHSTGQHLGFEYADYADSDPLYQKDVFLAYLRKAEKRNYLMSAVGVFGGATETVHDNGLIEGHAYGVLQILDVPCKDGKTRVLVKLRNPWGDHHEWRGTFSDDDEESWSLVKNNGQGIRVEECNGTFWMEASDFLDYFTHIEVLHFDMVNYTGDKVYSKGLRESQDERRKNVI